MAWAVSAVFLKAHISQDTEVRKLCERSGISVEKNGKDLNGEMLRNRRGDPGIGISEIEKGGKNTVVSMWRTIERGKPTIEELGWVAI